MRCRHGPTAASPLARRRREAGAAHVHEQALDGETDGELLIIDYEGGVRSLRRLPTLRRRWNIDIEPLLDDTVGAEAGPSVERRGEVTTGWGKPPHIRPTYGLIEFEKCRRTRLGLD